MEEFPKKNSDKKVKKDSPGNRAFELRKIGYPSFRPYMEILWENSELNNKKPAFILKVKENIIKIAPETLEDLHEVDSVLGILDEKNEDVLLDEAANVTIKIITKRLSLYELERRFNKYPLSRGLSFEIDKENKNRVNLYMPITFFKNPRQEAIESYIKGLRVLAQKMAADEEFKDIKEIIGRSPYVKKHHKLLKKHGFEITLDKDNNPTEEARMSKDKLLKLYGQK